MCLSKPARARAFTLIELLVVVAIISLLIAIVTPALQSVRIQARKAQVSSQIASIGKGCEMFNTEFSGFPRSTGKNPFETDDSVRLSGAQWLALQLVGADLRGYVKPTVQNDTNGDDRIDHEDWLEWYRLGVNYPRLSQYVTVDGKSAQSPEAYEDSNEQAVLLNDSSLRDGSEVWSNFKVPFFVDAFNFPILYYAANKYEKKNAFWMGNTSGRFDISDNKGFTGMDGGHGRVPDDEDGFDLVGDGKQHPLMWLWERGNSGVPNPQSEPERTTFAGELYNANIFQTTKQGNQGRVWPYRPDSYILISPGRDGLYGTSDDIRNFQANSQ
jgi:prepilin-type N-terminal cleavage/methylation domain-containing protein